MYALCSVAFFLRVRVRVRVGATTRAATAYHYFLSIVRIYVGWSAKATANGKTYYENHADKSTTWERPVAVPAAAGATAAGAAAVAAYTERAAATGASAARDAVAAAYAEHSARSGSGLSTGSNSRRGSSSSAAAAATADGEAPLPPGKCLKPGSCLWVVPVKFRYSRAGRKDRRIVGSLVPRG